MAITRHSIKEQVYLELKKMIHDNVFAPGDRINIDSVAREFGVSNSPVREAVNMLVRDGMLENTLNSGARVTKLDEVAYEELCFSLFVLIRGGFEICNEKGTMQELEDELKFRLTEQQKTLNNGDLDSQIIASNDFDRSFILISGNKRLLMMYDALWDVFYSCVRERLLKNKVHYHKVLAEHIMILEAVTNLDCKEVLKELKNHFLQSNT